MTKNNAIKIVAALLTLALGVFVSLFAEVGVEQDREVVMTVREYLVNSFVAELPEINRNLPHKVDNKTTLLSIKYLNGKVVTRYQLDGIGSDVSSPNISDIQFKKILKKQICLDEIKAKLLEVDVEFVEQYQDPKGGVVFETSVKKFDCLMFDFEKQF